MQSPPWSYFVYLLFVITVIARKIIYRHRKTEIKLMMVNQLNQLKFLVKQNVSDFN